MGDTETEKLLKKLIDIFEGKGRATGRSSFDDNSVTGLSEEEYSRKMNQEEAEHRRKLHEYSLTEKELRREEKADYKKKLEDLDAINKKLQENNRLLESGRLTEEEKNRIEEENFKLRKESLKKLTEANKYEEEQQRRALGFQDSLKKIKDTMTSVVRTVQSFNDAWAKADAAAASYTRTLGGTAAAMDRMRKNAIDNVVHNKIGINYNMSIDELLKAQEAYSRAVGRNLRIDNTQQETLAAMSKVMGPEGANQLAVAFENFGLSLNATGDHAAKMFKEASEYGISFDKYSQNVRENITIAQNYTFKNGLAGLENMARKAAAIKLDMKQIESFAGKVNTIEGAIGTAAKLQVLGGPFAAMSNPLDMLNESLTDMEGLTDRFIKMMGGFGQFNKATGEITVSAFNKMRIRQAAEAMGMDYSQVMNSIQAEGRRREIEKQFRATGNPNNLSEKMMELVKNSATFENGKAGVSINGEFKTLDQLQESDYELLVKETQSEAADIKDIAKTLRSLVDKREGFQKQLDANKARISERLGIGKGEGMILDAIGHSNTLLTIIAGIGAVNGVMSAFSNFGGSRLFGKGRLGRMGRGIRGGKGLRGAKGARVGRGATGKVGKSVGTKTFTNSAGKAYTMSAEGRVFNAGGKEIFGAAKNSALKGANFATEGVTKAAGSKIIKGGIGRTAKRAAIKVGGKKLATKLAIGGGSKLAGLGAAGASTGGLALLGGVGMLGDIGTEALVDSGKIKKGGAAHYGMKTASKAAEFAGYGAALGSIVPGLGTGIGAAAGAIIGGTIGFFQANAARRKEKYGNIVEQQLAAKGLSLQGDYRGGQLKDIDKALQTGEISDKLRRKMIENGDLAVIEEIKKVKQGEKGEGVEKNIAEAYFTVENAYFNEGEGGKSVARGKVAEEKDKSFGKDLEDSLSWGPLGGIALGIKRLRHGGGRDLLQGAMDLTPAGIIGKSLKGENAFGKGVRGVADTATEKAAPSVPTSITVNVNGAIKLTDSQGKSFDIAGQLLKDTSFIRELANLISKQMNISERGTNIVDKTSQKV